jgi:hypothetical protein
MTGKFLEACRQPAWCRRVSNRPGYAPLFTQKRMKLLAVGVFLLLLGACESGSQPSGSTSPTSTSRVATPTPSVPAAGLFVIATGLPGFQLINLPPTPGKATVQIVDANGRVYGHASFAPPPAPEIGNVEPLLQSPVRTAAGAVFYADSTGTVHKLKPDGSTSVVATFPLTNGQQELSYAVSPDGAHLIAIVLSTPPLHNPPPQSLGDPVFQEGGHWTLKLETADSGGTTTTTLDRDLGAAYPAPTEIVGWDAKGPLATLHTALGTQQAPLSAHFFGDQLIHIAADGTHLDPLGGPACTVADADWTYYYVLCIYESSRLVARYSIDGTDASEFSPVPTDNYYHVVAVQDLVATGPWRHINGGGSHLTALGWLDRETIVEADSTSGQLSLYGWRSLNKIRDLGLSGIFEGLLQPPVQR